MKRTKQLALAQTPDGSTLSLHEHDGTYSIRVNGRELMSTRHVHSEEKLAEVACTPYARTPGARVLIGGLGLGYTLRTALRCLAQDAEVLVAEIMQEIVDWNRNSDFPLAHDALADARTRLVMSDVYDVIAQAPRQGRFHAIMLDADNGTTAMSTEGNERLYDETGLAMVYGALCPGGLVVYWSAQQEPRFAKKMAKSGFAVEIQRIRAHATSGGMHTLLIGRTESTSSKFRTRG